MHPEKVAKRLDDIGEQYKKAGTEETSVCSNELLSCPFCGGKARQRYFSNYGKPTEWAECLECYANIRSSTKEGAIEKWNTRAG